MKIMFRVGIALFRRCERQLLGYRFEKLAECLGSKGLHALLPPIPDELIKVCAREKTLTQTWYGWLINTRSLTPACRPL